MIPSHMIVPGLVLAVGLAAAMALLTPLLSLTH